MTRCILSLSLAVLPGELIPQTDWQHCIKFATGYENVCVQTKHAGVPLKYQNTDIGAGTRVWAALLVTTMICY